MVHSYHFGSQCQLFEKLIATTKLNAVPKLCNFIQSSNFQFKRFRFMIIELILATDLMRHYELVNAFNKKVSCLASYELNSVSQQVTELKR